MRSALLLFGAFLFVYVARELLSQAFQGYRPTLDVLLYPATLWSVLVAVALTVASLVGFGGLGVWARAGLTGVAHCAVQLLLHAGRVGEYWSAVNGRELVANQAFRGFYVGVLASLLVSALEGPLARAWAERRAGRALVR